MAKDLSLCSLIDTYSAVLTDNVLDLMITGDSFFCIDPDISDAEVNFSRDGSFTIDANGDLVTQNSGYYVMGVMGDVTIGDNPTLTNIKVINRNIPMFSKLIFVVFFFFFFFFYL